MPPSANMLERVLRSVKFRDVAQAEDTKALIPPDHDEEAAQPQSHSRHIVPGLFLSLLWLLSILVALLAGAWLGGRHFGNIDKLCIEHVSQYSPVIEDIDISYNVVQYSGPLMHENIFRQNASAEVDAAWQSLGIDYMHIIVPPDQAEKSGLVPSQVQVSEKYGGGFPANVEGLHHLHCLNLLRQSLYYNFDYYHLRGEGAFGDTEQILRFHVSHCLDILRQQLMCTVDIAVLGKVWWNRDSPVPFPDFNTKHKCRNYDAIRQWAEERQAPFMQPPDYLMPPQSMEDVLEAMP